MGADRAKRNRGGEFSEVLPDTFIHYYYLAAVVVCLPIKDNPIKALKSILEVSRHTNTSQSGSSLGERTGCDAVWKACSFPPLPICTNWASGQYARGLGALRPQHASIAASYWLGSWSVAMPASPCSAFLLCVGSLVPQCTYAHLHCVPL